MSHSDKVIVWLHGEVKTPPFTANARVLVGYLLRLLQQGERLTMPYSRPMPTIGSRCHELRVKDGKVNWRLVYRIDHDAIILLEVFSKKTRATPKLIIDSCRKRLKDYDNEASKAGCS